MTRSYSPLRHQQNQPEPLAYRPKEAAQALGICERTLWALTQRGEVPHLKTALSSVTAAPLAGGAGCLPAGEADRR